MRVLSDGFPSLPIKLAWRGLCTRYIRSVSLAYCKVPMSTSHGNVSNESKVAIDSMLLNSSKSFRVFLSVISRYSRVKRLTMPFESPNTIYPEVESVITFQLVKFVVAMASTHLMHESSSKLHNFTTGSSPIEIINWSHEQMEYMYDGCACICDNKVQSLLLHIKSLPSFPAEIRTLLEGMCCKSLTQSWCPMRVATHSPLSHTLIVLSADPVKTIFSSWINTVHTAAECPISVCRRLSFCHILAVLSHDPDTRYECAVDKAHIFDECATNFATTLFPEMSYLQMAPSLPALYMKPSDEGDCANVRAFTKPVCGR